MEMVLNDADLLMEIFLRLPAKSLIRFKSVCKKWRSIISSDLFCHQHTLRRPKLQPSLILQINMQIDMYQPKKKQKRTLLFYLNPTIEGEKVMIPYKPAVGEYKILDACNGLLLLESVHAESACYGPRLVKDSLFVYNPTTRGSREISLPYIAEYPYLAEINLAFDPSKSPYYKIVCIWSTTKSSSGGSYTYQIRVYDSESRTWNLRVGDLKYPRISYGVYWNNAIYWGSNEGYYCCFNMCRNEMKTLTIPEIPGSYRNCVHELQESNGHLYHIDAHVAEDDDSESVVVWRLSKRSKWIFEHNDRLSDQSCKDGIGIVRFIGESDGDETCTLLIQQDEKIKSISFPDGRDVDLIDLTSQSFYNRRADFSVIGFIFGETLAVV